MLRPGTFGWLVAHDLRLNWRRFADMVRGGTPHMALLAGGAGLLVLHGLAWPVVPYLEPTLAGATGGEGAVVIGAALACVASWMLAQGLFAATRTLYDRGDLDLLLGSPLPPRRILAAKVMAIALSSLGSVGMLALPLADVGALRAGWHWLALYPTLAGIALMATALALIVTIWLFRVVGARRARLYAHMGGALIGGLFVLAAQVVAMLPDGARQAVTHLLSPVPGGARSLLQRVLWMPVDAALGDGWAMAALLAGGAGLFAAAAAVLGEQFARLSLSAAGTSDATQAKPGKLALRFGVGPARALRAKEWSLLLRDPGLFAQLGLQIVYTLPLAVVLVRSGTLPLVFAIAPSIVVIAAQVAASLAWIAISGEDAPELLATAPVQPRSVELAKLSAITLPVIIVGAVPLACLALVSGKAALVTAPMLLGASASTAMLNLWHPMPGNRRGMLRRHAQSKLVGLIEHVIAVLWAIASVLALIGSWLIVLPLGLSLAVLGLSRRMGREDRGAGRKAERRRKPDGTPAYN